MSNEKIIGVLGGVGPYAGIDLCRIITNQTISNIDQDHLSVMLFSLPSQIDDRTEYIVGNTDINPAYKILEIIKRLETAGAGVIGIPCNTIHAPQIYDVLLSEIIKSNIKVKLIHMISEVLGFIKKHYPLVRDIGILSTLGTYQSNIYNSIFEAEGYNLILPDENLKRSIHEAIYNPVYGAKAYFDPVTRRAKSAFIKAIESLRSKGSELVILGCTEICYSITEEMVNDIIVINSSMVLARALIREVAPHKLKPYQETT